MAAIIVRADDGREIEITIDDENGWACWSCPNPGDAYEPWCDGATFYSSEDAIQDAVIHADTRHGGKP